MESILLSSPFHTAVGHLFTSLGTNGEMSVVTRTLTTPTLRSCTLTCIWDGHCEAFKYWEGGTCQLSNFCQPAVGQSSDRSGMGYGVTDRKLLSDLTYGKSK